MEDQLVLLSKDAVLAIPDKDALALIRAGEGDAALLYLLLLRQGGSLSAKEAADALRWPVERLKKAHSALKGLGLLASSGRRKDALSPSERDTVPDYTAADIAREMEKPSHFSPLVSDVQRRLGKVLSSSDLKILFGIYDYLGLPAEVISMLVTHCIEESERRYGKGRKPTLRQIEREAFRWSAQEVDTPEQVAAYLKRLEERRDLRAKAARALRIADRPLVAREQSYVDSWLDMGFPPETISCAYEETVFRKGSMNWSYCNGILRSWHQKGLHTPEEVQKAEQPASPQPRQEDSLRRSDMEWIRSYLKREKNSSSS